MKATVTKYSTYDNMTKPKAFDMLPHDVQGQWFRVSTRYECTCIINMSMFYTPSTSLACVPCVSMTRLTRERLTETNKQTNKKTKTPPTHQTTFSKIYVLSPL